MKLRFILLVFLFSSVLFCINCSYAFDYHIADVKIDKQQIFDILIEYTGIDLDNLTGTNLDVYNSFINSDALSDNVYTCFNLHQSTPRPGRTAKTLVVDFSDSSKTVINGTNSMVTGSRAYVPCTRFQFQNYTIITLSETTYNNGTTIDAGSISNNYYLNQNNDGKWYESANGIFSNIDMGSYSNLKFVPYPTSSINVVVNGVSKTFLRLPYSTSVNRVRLGTLTGFSGVSQINGYFGPWVSDSITDVSSATFNWVTNLSPRNGSLSVDSTGAVYINTSKLFNKQGFQLYITYKDNVTDNTNTDLGSWEFYSYFYGEDVPDTISGDSSLVNPNLNSNVDVAWINAFGDLTQSWYDNSSGDIDYSLGSSIFNFGFNFSGDGFSGDFFNNLGFKDYTTSTYDLFIYRIYRQVIDVLNGTRNVPTLTFNYRGNNFSFNASDFTVPDNALKSFCSSFLIAGTVYLCILQVHRLLLMLTTLDLFHFLRAFDKDHSLFM